MSLSRDMVRSVIDIYIRAWITQDPELIVTIFNDAATYHERVLEEPIRNKAGIKRYWEEKVVHSQRNISCEVLNIYVDGDTAIVEWQAEFDDVATQVRKRIREVAILVFEGEVISSLREYWVSADLQRTSD